jgi:hypothetical protein
MKTLLFFDNVQCGFFEFSPEANVPSHIARFEVGDELSTFCPRYILKDDNFFDNYDGKTDEEVAIIIQNEEIKKAEELASLNKR